MILHDCEQGSDEWFKLRAGKPTSSMFGSVITGLGKPSTALAGYASILAFEKRWGPIKDGFQGNKYTDRGTVLEDESRADYAMTNQVEIQEVGFITDDLMRWGSSTDGLVGADGVVEFKNLIAKQFMKVLIYVQTHNRTPPEYIPQLQGELFVTERKWVDIVFYHPQTEPIVQRHYPIPEFHETLKKQLVAVIAERNNILKSIRSKE